MKNLLYVALCLLPLALSCGKKKENKETPAQPSAQEQIVPPGVSGHAGKPGQVRDEVNDTIQMREADNERRLKEIEGQ
ncbi:hypothetical protein KJ975_09015 [Myxococcota bacterium]|nr:hypothetical protein [Myxococcota bacterium]